MTFAEILEQVKMLSPRDRSRLMEHLQSMDVGAQKPRFKTGAEIVAMLENMEPVETLYPEIEDPVEWVKQIRRDQAKKRNLDWGDRG